MSQKFVLLMHCEDAVGIIHNVTGILLRRGFNIVEQGEYVDPESHRFFLRTAVEHGESAGIEEEFRSLGLEDLWFRFSEERRHKIVLFCGKEAHCPGDLLIRHHSGELPATIEAVVSNRSDLQELVERFDVPFYHISADGISREEHESRVLKRLSEFSCDFLVLAKYMRILTAEFTASFPERIINIHHSFLPAFIGAKPYHRAHKRGVKIIGATAHFVTSDLDEGPIIAQDIEPVSHRQTVSDLIRCGHDVEKIVLARSLRLVLQHRVVIFQNRTILFD
jgi:formyltetrahydrofolate deformylase